MTDSTPQHQECIRPELAAYPKKKKTEPSLKVNLSKFETPLALRHVESHLIFGPLSRRFPAAWAALAVFVTFGLVVWFTPDPGRDLLSAAPGLTLFPLLLWYLSRATLRQQAAFFWFISKFLLGLGGLLLLPITLILWLHEGRTDLRPIAYLALIWLPLLEFIPRLTPYQRYITLARILLSIPCFVDIATNPRNTWS